jgi:MYXO-CTERM domain-containing protein
MKRAHLLASILLLTAVSFAQQPSSPSDPQDRAANPTDQNYSRPVETGHNWGGWGLLGLLGLAGLLGRRRETTTTIDSGYTRDDRTYGQQRRAG